MKANSTFIKTSFLLLILVFTTTLSFSQPMAWQWIKSGGSTGSTTSDDYWEFCREVYTDDNGNVYGFSCVSDGYTKIDTIERSMSFGSDDLCVFSYRCDGSFRWARFFGYVYSDKPGGICVDGDGNTYITGLSGVSQYSDCHFGDTIIPQTTSMLKSNFVAKIDSTGHTEWISLPGPTFFSSIPGHMFLQTELDSQGDPNVFVRFFGSCTYEGFAIPDSGQYVFKFDKNNGDLLNITKLDIKMITGTGLYSYFYKIDPLDNNIYLMTGVANLTQIGGDTIFNDISNVQHTDILARFSPDGQVVWYTIVSGFYHTETIQAIWGKPVFHNNSVYISGETFNYPGASFMGVPVSNMLADNNGDRTKIFARFNKTTGAFQSVIHLDTEGNIFSSEMAVRNNKIIAACGGTGLVIMNQNDTVYPIPPAYINYPFVVEMDTALTQFNWGVAIEAEGVPRIWSITVDNSDNIYIGGWMNGTMYNSFGVPTNTIGGEDFFIAKVAIDNNCGCAYSEPQAELVSFTDNILTVSGTVVNPADSLYWYWGDGDSTQYISPGTNISHTYSAPGPYTVCLVAWNLCGPDQDCLSNLISGIDPTMRNAQIVCYPNPFNNSLSIEVPVLLAGAEAKLYTLPGEQILSTKLSGIKTTLDVGNLKSGIYLLKLTAPDGEVFVKKVMKE